MMRNALLFLLPACLAWSVPARANEFEQAWACTLLTGKTLDQVRAVAADWLRAARGMQGGDGLQLRIRWPIVVADSAERFEFVVQSPSLQAWGAFYDHYDPDSPAGKADAAFAEVASCSGSTLWETIAVN